MSAPGSSAAPQGDIRSLSGSVGPREDGMGYEDRDGDWEWSRCQPGHSVLALTPGTATCPQAFRHQVCPKNIPMCPPRAKGLGWTPLGQQGTQGGSSHTQVLLSITYSSRKISTNFPNLLELSFLTVLALPKDSSKGVASRICHGDGKSWGGQPGHPTHHGTSPRLGHPLSPCHPHSNPMLHADTHGCPNLRCAPQPG